MPCVIATLCATPSADLTVPGKEKARYVREVNRPCRGSADSWGYAGETQELHYLPNKLPNAA